MGSTSSIYWETRHGDASLPSTHSEIRGRRILVQDQLRLHKRSCLWMDRQTDNKIGDKAMPVPFSFLRVSCSPLSRQGGSGTSSLPAFTSRVAGFRVHAAAACFTWCWEQIWDCVLGQHFGKWAFLHSRFALSRKHLVLIYSLPYDHMHTPMTSFFFAVLIRTSLMLGKWSGPLSYIPSP